MKQSDLDFLHNLRQASSYVEAHRGKTCVIYLKGELILDQESLKEFAEDIGHLHALGLKIVLVMGATPQINQALKQANISWQEHQNFRITTAEMLPILQSTLGMVRSQLEAAFNRQQMLNEHPLSLVSGNWITAQPKGVIDGIDFQHTGETRKVNEQAIQAILDAGQIVLLTPLAYSLTGEVFNLNTLELACNVANKINAYKLVVFTDDQQMEQLPKQISLYELKQFKPHNPNQIWLWQQLITNADKIQRVHLMNESDPSSLLIELYSRDGIGTLVFTDRYHEIRTAKLEDASQILDLIEPLEATGRLVKRSKEKLESEIEKFIVVERDNKIIGSAALYGFENNSAELACLAISPDYQGQGIGEQLLEKIEQLAKNSEISKLFLLTTHTDHWFIEHGFNPAKVLDLPESRQQIYNHQRQSKVLIKDIK